MVSKGDVKVGIFVLMGIALAGLAIFLIGDERRLFERSVSFRAEFYDVQGLKHGAPVRMGGVRIGQVKSVRYGEDPRDRTVYVELSVVRSEAGRIMSDSLAVIKTKGLLGDKMVTISKGSKMPPIEAGGLIPSKEPDDVLKRVDRMATKAESTLVDIGHAAESFGDKRFHRELREATHGVNVFLHQVTEGEGYPRRFLNDPQEAERISRTVASFERSANELAATLSEIRVAVQRVRTGPGFAHDVLYSTSPPKSVAQIGDAAEQIAQTLREVRQSDSFAHDVLFGGQGDAAGALSDLRRIMADLRDIVGGIKKGKGTLGALLVDPSVYEDVKRVIGNVERNDVLRALVRYSIKQDEKKTPVQVGTKGD